MRTYVARWVIPLCLWSVSAPAQTLPMADCNGNGVDDVEDILAGVVDDCNANEIPDVCETAPLPLRNLSSFFVEGFVSNALLGDFDADGFGDWAIGYRGGLALYRGDGGGDAEAFDATVVPVEGRSIQWGTSDFDGDGDLDVVSLDKTGLWHLENRGDATFEAPSFVPVSDDLTTLGVADLSGDGADDVVVTDRGRQVLLVLRNTGGNFAASGEYAVGRVPRLALAHLNGDGAVDVVTANQFSDDLTLLVNVGDGSLMPAEAPDTGGEAPLRIVADDLDEDGRDDLIVASGGAIVVYPNRTSAGAPTAFAEPRRFLPGAGGPTALTTGDVDSDGDPDVLCAFTSPIRVVACLGDGAGFFDAAAIVQEEIKVDFLRLADVNGDLAPDLIVSPTRRKSVNVVWNEPELGASPVLFREALTLRVPGDPHTAALVDVEGDGDLDLIAGNNNEGISIYRNDGNGAFAEPENYPTSAAFGLGFSFSIAVADLDGDGDPDIASADIAGNRLQILVNDGAGVFSAPVSYASGDNPFHVTTADLDQDGQIDVLSANEAHNNVTLLYNVGAATFTGGQHLPVGARPISVAAGDLDGDGDPDLTVANVNSSDLSIIENHGDRSYANAASHPLFGAPNFVRLDDLDGDGQIDLLNTSQVNRSVSVFFGGGRLTLGAPQIYAVHTFPYSFVTSDLDFDGDLDVVTISEQSDGVSVLVNNGDRTFSLSDPLRVGDGPRYVVAGDIDADGDRDIIGANRVSRTLSVLFNDTSSRQQQPFLETICTAAEYHQISVPDGPLDRVAKYLVPARDDATLLPTVFQNAQLFLLHEDFLRAQFPDRFAGLSGAEYDRLVARRATRDYFAGFLRRRRAERGFVYTFSVVADTGFDSRELLSREEIVEVYERLRIAFPLQDLAYEPLTELEREQAAGWGATPFTVFLDDGRGDVPYEAYTLATGFGRVRRLTLQEFEEANRSGLFTFQDVLVVDQAPRDIEGVVGGVVTGQPQGALSHVAIRTARRGTPNAFVEGAREAFEPFDGKLVRLDVFETEYVVQEATLPEAEAFWEANRPRLAETPAIDESYAPLASLVELELDGATSPVARHGGKAANFSRLQSLWSGVFEAYRERGLSIPVKYYFDFLRENSLEVDGNVLTFEERLTQLLADPQFQSDSRRRFEALEELRGRMREEGSVSETLVAEVASRIEQVFGDTTTMVRFRSSSNVEDALIFNGAGLYESTSVCVADTLDPSDRDASFCDPFRDNERTIERALKKVWASLWTFRAHEERTFFQIPPESVAMGILVTRAFLDEAANGVAFTGNPSDARDKRYVVTTQIGEESVVSPEPGTTVETSLLEVVDGTVEEIIRSRSSSLVAPGEFVVSDAQLRELGELMAFVDERFPLDLEGHPREQVLLDFEFKIEPDGVVAIKQVRPFLIPTAVVPTPTFALEIPESTTVCAVFSEERVGRTPRVEYETRSQVDLSPGLYELETSSDSFRLDLVDVVRFGPDRAVAEEDGPGTFALRRLAGDNGETVYRFVYRQHFRLPDGAALELVMTALDFRARGATPVSEALVFDDEFLTFSLSMQAVLDGQPVSSYSSCGATQLPLWRVSAGLKDELALELEERFLPSPQQLSTGPASLVRAEVALGGSRQTIADYWRLVYTARRHNQDVAYWIALDPALELPSLPTPVGVVELVAPEPPAKPEATIRYLGVDLEPLGPARPAAFEKEPLTSPPARRFVRGDADSSGRLELTDALTLLNFLFQNGSSPSCAKAADADDNGRLDILDAIRIVGAIAGRGLLAEPLFCGTDPTEDGLECRAPPACP